MEYENIRDPKAVAVERLRGAGKLHVNAYQSLLRLENNSDIGNLAEDVVIAGFCAFAGLAAVSYGGGVVIAGKLAGGVWAPNTMHIVFGRAAAAIVWEGSRRAMHELFDANGVMPVVPEKDYSAEDNLFALAGALLAAAGGFKELQAGPGMVSAGIVISKKVDGLKPGYADPKDILEQILKETDITKRQLDLKVSEICSNNAKQIVGLALDNTATTRKHAIESGYTKKLITRLWDESPILYKIHDELPKLLSKIFSTELSNPDEARKYVGLTVELYVSSLAEMGYWKNVCRTLNALEAAKEMCVSTERSR